MNDRIPHGEFFINEKGECIGVHYNCDSEEYKDYLAEKERYFKYYRQQQNKTKDVKSVNVNYFEDIIELLKEIILLLKAEQ